MTATAITDEIGNLNLSYLLLAQRLVREDLAVAMFRLGISRELADLLGTLSLSQVLKLASSSMVLCRFRLEDQPILHVLASETKTVSLQQAHASILLSSQRIEQVAAVH
ncbi:MAG: flagellar transcriptional regulator FlhD [Pseudomonadota bacterium]